MIRFGKETFEQQKAFFDVNHRVTDLWSAVQGKLSRSGGTITGDLVVEGNADIPGWQPVLDSATGQPIVEDTRLQGIGQGVIQFDGTWQLLRVHFTGDADPGGQSMRLRINDDTTASAHRSFGTSRDATVAGSNDPTTWDINAGAWEIGPLSSGFADTHYTIEIGRAGIGTALKTFNSFGYAGGRIVQSGGRTVGLVDTSPVRSLRFIIAGGGQFGNSPRVTIEGLRA